MWRIAILVLLVLAVSLPTYAKTNKHEKHYKAEKINKQQQAERSREEIFSPAERNMIRAQLQQEERNKKQKKQKKQKNLPPGLQKKVARGKELPPGWQKKVAPGDSLDYQVYRQGLNLPEEILRRLPQQPTGSEIIQVDDRIIRLNSATRTILDVFNLNPTP